MTWEEIKASFDAAYAKDHVIQSILADNRITYAEANRYAIRVGDILGKIIGNTDVFPEGIGFNDALRILDPALRNNYNIAKQMAMKAQKATNDAAGLGLKVAEPRLKEDMLEGLAKEVSDRGIETRAELFKDQITHFTQTGVDDTVSVNAYEHERLGVDAKVVRRAEYKACEWCRDLEGSYKPSEAEALGVYRRHDNCRCTVEYVVNKQRTTVHSGTEGRRKYVKQEGEKNYSLTSEAAMERRRQRQEELRATEKERAAAARQKRIDTWARKKSQQG